MVENMRRMGRKKKIRQKTEAPTMAVRSALKQPEKNTQRDPGEKGWTCYYCGKEGHLKQNCLQASKPPPVPSAKDHTRRETAPRGKGFRGWTFKTNRTESAQGSPHSSHPNYT